MGTSKSISTPSGGDWSPLKQDISSQFGGGTPRCTPTALVGRTVQAAGGVGILSSIGGPGRGQGRGGTGSGSARISRTLQGLGGFGAFVATRGLGDALEQLGLVELRGRPAVEVVARIVVFAGATRASALHIAENGLIALNPPLGLSRIGSLSTRTAHPRFLWQFRKLVEELRLFGGELKNPFMFQSKTDLAETLAPALRTLVLESVSCSHGNVGLIGGRGDTRHCGHCIPCLHRRFALAAAGLDDPRHYVDDAFSRLGNMTARNQANLRMLVAFAARVARMDNAQLQGLATSHGWFPPQVGGVIGPRSTDDYQPWADMLLRWARMTLRQVEEHCSANTKRRLRS
jgi:hypothetical protein